MKRSFLYITIAVISLLTVFSCGNDDEPVDDNFIPARDREDEAPLSTAIIEEYLETHFYNYEEFQNPPKGFDFVIKFDTIAGDNSQKIPLIEQVSSKMVTDRRVEGLEYKLYYLNVIEGGGEKPNFCDVATLSYEGTYINKESTLLPYTKLFDSSTIPINFDLTAVVNGFQDGVIEFNTATNFIVNPDGSVSFENYGVGAVFMQAGLAYYVNPPPTSAIPLYANLIFSFQIYDKQEGDQDEDGVPSLVEDLNGNEIEEDDDTDGDGIPNYLDTDDDNDQRPTRDEIEIDDEGNITYPDTDNDGIPDYLDADS